MYEANSFLEICVVKNHENLFCMSCMTDPVPELLMYFFQDNEFSCECTALNHSIYVPVSTSYDIQLCAKITLSVSFMQLL